MRREASGFQMTRRASRRRLLGAIAAAIVVAAALALLAESASSAAAPGGVCAVPDALLAAGEKAEAKKLYVAILKSAPATDCAVAGLKQINAPTLSCEAADAKFQDGKLADALAEYRRLGESECATAGITAVREVMRLCAEGSVNLRLEHDPEARAAYQKALAKSPEASCAEAGLNKLDSLSYKLDSLSFTGLMQDIVAWTPEVLTAIGVAALLFFLLLLTGYSRRIKRVLLRIPIARNILSPRLSLAPIDDSSHKDKLGEALSARIREQLQRDREEALGVGDDYDLDYGNGREDFVNIVSGSGALQNALKNARDISDQTKVVAALLDLLYGILPIRKISVVGVLEPPAGREACATFSLQDDVQQAAAITLSVPAAADPPTYADYSKLPDLPRSGSSTRSHAR